MNIEIKFRAWDKKINKMFKVFSFCKDFIKVVAEGMGDGVLKYPIDYFELMQYIGLKDKNGKEWYDGDLVRVNKDAPIHETFWCEEQMGWKIRLFRKGVEPHWFNINASIFEIIGNIYQNPELVK